MAKKKKEKPSEDTVRLVRAIIKMSVAINDIDEIEHDGFYFRYQFKKKISAWLVVFQASTHNILSVLQQSNSDLAEQIYKNMEFNGVVIEGSRENKMHLILLYMKLKSAMNDLNEIVPKEKEVNFTEEILKRSTNSVIECMEGQFNFLKRITDANGKDMSFLIEYYDDLGKKIMHLNEK